MVLKMSAPGRSFGGVADYCLHDRWVPGEPHPESAERVEWTETRNVATDQGERASRIMAATAEASPELKRLAGGAATGRKLEKPVCHYSLNWAKDEKPDRQEMRRAVEESLKALIVGKWRDPRSFRRAKGRNAVVRSGTMAPAAEEGRVSPEECGPNATRGLAE